VVPAPVAPAVVEARFAFTGLADAPWTVGFDRYDPKREKRRTVVKLRLMRMGKKKQPTYRVVAAESRSPRDGRFIEIVGHYDPRRDPSVISINNERAAAWLAKGAQPTETVAKLLKISGAYDVGAGTAAP
jgi:small subunit ribosomal protein S16